jgi:hypothetical protein
MEIPKYQFVETGPADHVPVSISAIQKQQAAESLNVDRSAPGLAISENRKKPWLFLIALLILLSGVLLLRYEDVLLPLYKEVVAEVVVFTTPTSTPAVENGQLQRQLDMAREISLVLTEEPSRLGEIVSSYRNILLENPGQPEALSALQQLSRQCLLLVSFYMASGESHIAREIAEDSLLYFPELADDPLWSQLMMNLPESTIGVPITEDVVDGAIEGQELEVVTESDPETEIETHTESGALITASMPEVSSKLPVDKTLASGSLQTEQQLTIERLLQEAKDFRKKGIQFTQQDNAVTRYQDVLALQPGQVDAVAGLKALIDTRVAYVKRLLAEKDLDTAQLMLEPALRHFPDNSQLLALSRQIGERGGVISSLAVDFLPEDKMDSALVTVDGQTLLLSLSYKFFPNTTTVVNAQLFNLPRLDAIAAVPIIVQHPRGSKTVQMSTLGRKIEDGRYLLTLSSGDKSLIKHEFTVKDNTINNNSEL